MMTNSFWYNPFTRIAGSKSLFLGISGFIIISLLSYWTGTHLTGLTKIDFAGDTFLAYYTIEQIISWLTISVFFYLAGIVLSKSKIRLIDILGTTLLARIPLLLVPAIRLLPIFKSFVYQSPEMYLLHGLYLLSAIWVIALLFNAYKISCNLRGEKLIASFTICLILSEILCRVFIHPITLKI